MCFLIASVRWNAPVQAILVQYTRFHCIYGLNSIEIIALSLGNWPEFYSNCIIGLIVIIHSSIHCRVFYSLTHWQIQCVNTMSWEEHNIEALNVNYESHLKKSNMKFTVSNSDTSCCITLTVDELVLLCSPSAMYLPDRMAYDIPTASPMAISPVTTK